MHFGLHSVPVPATWAWVLSLPACGLPIQSPPTSVDNVPLPVSWTPLWSRQVHGRATSVAAAQRGKSWDERTPSAAASLCGSRCVLAVLCGKSNQQWWPKKQIGKKRVRKICGGSSPHNLCSSGFWSRKVGIMWRTHRTS
jgi:hypothetical protein